jgi:hypothetical protein
MKDKRWLIVQEIREKDLRNNLTITTKYTHFEVMINNRKEEIVEIHWEEHELKADIFDTNVSGPSNANGILKQSYQLYYTKEMGKKRWDEKIKDAKLQSENKKSNWKVFDVEKTLMDDRLSEQLEMFTRLIDYKQFYRSIEKFRLSSDIYQKFLYGETQPLSNFSSATTTRHPEPQKEITTKSLTETINNITDVEKKKKLGPAYQTIMAEIKNATKEKTFLPSKEKTPSELLQSWVEKTPTEVEYKPRTTILHKSNGKVNSANTEVVIKYDGEVTVDIKSGRVSSTIRTGPSKTFSSKKHANNFFEKKVAECIANGYVSRTG